MGIKYLLGEIDEILRHDRNMILGPKLGQLSRTKPPESTDRVL